MSFIPTANLITTALPMCKLGENHAEIMQIFPSTEFEAMFVVV